MPLPFDNYKVGDTCWYIPGYSGNYLLAIKCHIIEIDDVFEMNGVRFYWLDEPVGHGVASTDDDVFLSIEEALRELMRRFDDNHSSLEQLADIDGANEIASLEYCRIETEHFITSTWAGINETPKFPVWPTKLPRVDWLNVQMVREVFAEIEES